MGTQVVPFRMAETGVQWCDTMARNQGISRSDVIRMALQYAKEAEVDMRFSAYLKRAVKQGRITAAAETTDTGTESKP